MCGGMGGCEGQGWRGQPKPALEAPCKKWHLSQDLKAEEVAAGGKGEEHVPGRGKGKHSTEQPKTLGSADHRAGQGKARDKARTTTVRSYMVL